MSIEKGEIKILPRGANKAMEWLNQCPLCQMNNAHSLITLNSDYMNAHFALCKKCMIALSNKIDCAVNDDIEEGRYET